MFGQVKGRCIAALLLLACVAAAQAKCPYAASQAVDVGRKLLTDHQGRSLLAAEPPGGFSAVKQDIKALLTSSQAFWPADFGHYGPLMIRLAWHCSGSYRNSDGRGGCDGGRIRFNPEHSWPDNTNLDKALRLLQPIKLKYGDALSWGDLIVLTGNTAIEGMGGPVLGFCGGRQDDADGSSSLQLGPSPEQEAIAPCELNGNCTSPLGPTTVGLIYVNPEGHLAVPDPAGSVPDIKAAFGHMGMSDRETVALIGGGHSFGKMHGACKTGPGPSPTEDPRNPWPGTCGTGPGMGKGLNTFTAGFQGLWTIRPTQWTNEYFQNLLDYNWGLVLGPGGHFQWKPTSAKDGSVPDPVVFLTSDVALLQDPSYLALSTEFAENITSLEDAFSHAWYKLTTQDMGPASRCIGDDVPPPQPFQDPLPPPPAGKVDYAAVRTKVKQLIASTSNGNELVRLAWQCASTFRATDHRGGCNGARIRFAPESTWPANKGLNKVLAALKPVKDAFAALTWADLIVLAGQTALEQAGSNKMTFCSGRSDAVDGSQSEYLAPRIYADVIVTVRDNMQVMGLTPRALVALAARNNLSKTYFSTLLTGDWKPVAAAGVDAAGKPVRYKAATGVYATAYELALVWDPEYKAIVQEYAADETVFKTEFAAAWTSVVNADRFAGPDASVCAA